MSKMIPKIPRYRPKKLYNIMDAYLHYCVNYPVKVTYEEYIDIFTSYMELSIVKVVKGEIWMIPKGLGRIFLKKRKFSFSNIKNLQASIQFNTKAKTPAPITLHEHSNNYCYYIYWKIGKIKYLKLYKYRPSNKFRKLVHRLASDNLLTI